MDIRRLAAVDMHGSAGASWRRWVILAEFLLGVVGGLALGFFVILSADGGPGRTVFGAWLLGVALNYAPLAAHALSLIRPGALERELAGVDVPAALRHYTTRQFAVLVPLLFVVWEVRRRL
ncbi:hypothetical protein O7635_29040 [Asanoa sp. WMMD1127]|uniref:hypothetical protein n=1 Tax=Asanoa sp. WMMD1127 TaxID=3016107 RepID=UPI0024159F19|nr:hypothetical protein [Asanoa sp. WMMD1127]MDG4825913.1 hypothetical protein [Asanoa sp. WMMD1127]